MNKVMSLHDAVAKYAESGGAVCFDGSTMNRKPYAAVLETLRQGQTDFTVWAGPAGDDWDMMIGEGRVKAYINCYTTNSGYTNVSRRFRAVIKAGTPVYKDYSQDALMLQLHAASLGLPYLPVHLMQGSGFTDFWDTSEEKRRTLDRLTNLRSAYVENPFNPGEKVVAVPTPQFDTAIIHVQKASPDGTCVIEGGEFHDADVAVAAGKVIVTCKEFVNNKHIRQEPLQNKVFSERVNAVVHVPLGVWPSQYYNYYDYDDKALRGYNKAPKYQDKGDAERQIAKEEEKAEKKGLPYTAPVNPGIFRDYLDKWVHSCRDNNDVLDKTGGTHLASLKIIPGFSYARRQRREKRYG